MRILGNILWLIFGGLILGLLWALAGLICCITIIGIPFGIQCFKIAALAFAPVGKVIDYGKFGAGSLIGNIIWLLIFGWGLALAHLVIGLIYCITIIGIPFGLQSFKMAMLALIPFGATITNKE